MAKCNQLTLLPFKGLTTIWKPRKQQASFMSSRIHFWIPNSGRRRMSIKSSLKSKVPGRGQSTNRTHQRPLIQVKRTTEQYHESLFDDFNSSKPIGYTSKCSGPYWSNPSFLIFWHSVLSAWVPECQKIKKGMALNALVDSFCHNPKKCETERVKRKSLLNKYCHVSSFWKFLLCAQ